MLSDVDEEEPFSLQDGKQSHFSPITYPRLRAAPTLVRTVPEPESSISQEEYNTHNPGGELPMRALVECAVFTEDAETGALLMRDLQTLDADPQPALDVVGRIMILGEDGLAFPNVQPGAFVRLSGVKEWSVEYDELAVTVWVSTETADYKLLSPAPLYAPLWEVLQRKAALAARVLALLSEEPTMTYKTLCHQTIRCNKIPDAIQFRQVRG